MEKGNKEHELAYAGRGGGAKVLSCTQVQRWLYNVYQIDRVIVLKVQPIQL